MSSRRPLAYFAPLILAGLMGVASAASAAQPGDYAWRWQLDARGQNAAWQFELTPEVYAALVDADLRDFEVFNADGQPVPVARLTVDPEATPGVARVPLPVYALPRGADAGVGGDDLSLRIERDGGGRLRLLQADVAAATPQTMIDYVIDADLSRDPLRPSTVDRLELEWPVRGDVRARFALEGSEDLEHWQTLVDAAAVVVLNRDGAMLQRRDIEFPATSLRYLRLRQLDGDPVSGLRVTARRTRAGVSVPQWRRLTAHFVETAPDTYGGGHLYSYRLPAKLPVGRVGVRLSADNATAQVVIDAQTSPSRMQPTWVPVGQALLFRLRQGDLRIDNDDLVLGAPLSAREWRLRSPVTLNPTPRVEVSYLPDRFVFLAQGPGPYTLAAGSHDARREDLPVEQALAPLRARLGPGWMPPVAGLGARDRSAGKAAYERRGAPVDWRGWLLWVLLVGGAVAVGGFAVTLIRQQSAARSAT